MRILVALSSSLSLIAVIAALYTLGKVRDEERLPSFRTLEEEAAADRQRLDRFEAGFAALEARTARLERTAMSPPDPDRAAAGVPAEDEDAAASREAFEERLEAELEERLEEFAREIDERLQRTVSVTPTGIAGISMETEEQRLRVVEESQRIAVDPVRTTAERLGALRQLRSRGGRSREVTMAMVEMILDPQTPPRMRADIIRNLDGVEFEELKEPLLHVLQTDPHWETRSETVETLQAFYGDPRVHAAIVHVRDHDVDERVRMEAVGRLQQYEEYLASTGKREAER